MSPGFSPRKAGANPAYQSRTARRANPDFPMEFAGLPWDVERAEGLGRSPKKAVRLFTTQ
jgi:hypothetical protein